MSREGEPVGRWEVVVEEGAQSSGAHKTAITKLDFNAS